MQYGEMDIDEEVAGDYIGMGNNGSDPVPAPAPSILPALPAIASTGGAELQALWTRLQAGGSRSSRSSSRSSSKGEQEAYAHAPQRHADLLPLLHAAHRGKDAGKRTQGRAALAQALKARQAVDYAAVASVRALLTDVQAAPLLLTHMGWDVARVFPAAPPMALAAATQLLAASQQPPQRLQGVGADVDEAGAHDDLSSLLGAPSAAAVELLVNHPLRRPSKDAPLVDSWDCLRGMVQVGFDEFGW